MEPTIEILISSPLSGSEAAALRAFVEGLSGPALILANFEIQDGGSSHEIDFVVVTERRAELVELKNISAPVRGGVNGPWKIETSPGCFVPYSGPNPWEQARDAKLALSDAMSRYAKHRPAVPGPARERYFKQFDASVTVYPKLMPGSEVPASNFKVWVRSFPETLDALNNRPLPVRPTWGIHEWRTFAIEHLGLTPTTLPGAIDSAVFEASQSVEAYAASLRGADIAPLLRTVGQELVGQNVIDKLRGPADVLLLGRSGLGKSFHLDHYRRVCFGFDELPILLHARYYERHLNEAINKSVGPYTSLAPASLLDAGERAGRRPVLILDGWNDCPEQLQRDLGDDLGAFKLRHNARLVAASQSIPSHALFGSMTTIELDALRDEHKQAIFSFHAGLRNVDMPSEWYEPFPTAFDLTIAGRCQASGAIAGTRTALYESYVRSLVKSVSTMAALRELAWYMGEKFKPALRVCDFERVIERLVRKLGLPLIIADELLASRILAVERGVVAFEHDLLKDYFRAEHVFRRTRAEHLAVKLGEPKYVGLTDLVMPCVEDESVVRELLERSSSDLLSKAFRGWLGPIAKDIVRDGCRKLVAGCRDQLPELRVEASIGERGDGRRFVSGAWVAEEACASEYDAKLCVVIANNLNDRLLRDSFLELLDLGEWALRAASERAGREHGVKAAAVFRELLHHNVILPRSASLHPLLFICHLVGKLRTVAARRSDMVSIRQVLLDKVGQGVAGALALLLLMFEVRLGESAGVADVFAIARQAWDTGLWPLRMEALVFVQSNAIGICEAGHEAEERAIELLDKFDVRGDVLLSTQLANTRSSFSGFDMGVDVDTALREFRRILAVADAGDDPDYRLWAETDQSLTFVQFVGGWASATLEKIFEDLFRGVYAEAFEALSRDEKRRLLILALQEREVHFATAWCLREICKVGCEGAAELVSRYACRVDPDTLFPAARVECFVTAQEVWAQVASEPIPYKDIVSEDHHVWAIVGELIFWLSQAGERSAGRTSFLCSELARFPLAVPDVLRQVGRYDSSRALRSLLTTHASGVRNALHGALQCGKSFTSVFTKYPESQSELFLWTISTLGDIGDGTSMALLLPWTESSTYGGEAIRAIEKIGGRRATSGA